MARFLILLVMVASPAPAQTQMQNCRALWDMALVARALAEDDLPQPQVVRILARIYQAPQLMLEQIASAAKQSALPAGLFAGLVADACERVLHPQSLRRVT